MTKVFKCSIVNLDDGGPPIEAQFNPKEISIDKSIPWNKDDNPKGDSPILLFTNAENRSLSLELFFDGFEKKQSVEGQIAALHKLTLIRNKSKEEEKHPPRVMVTWALGQKFSGVIESLNVKYTMFLENGTPVRATCTLKIKETDKAQKKQESNAS